jgi:hypothetical protein
MVRESALREVFETWTVRCFGWEPAPSRLKAPPSKPSSVAQFHQHRLP